MKITTIIVGVSAAALLLSGCGESQSASEEKVVAEAEAGAVQEPMAYGRFVPDREDDFAWENDKVAFRVYGPASRGVGPVSGVDAWFKKVDYPIIDKWYAERLEGKSYHEDRGEGYDPFHVGPTRGVGGGRGHNR